MRSSARGLLVLGVCLLWLISGCGGSGTAGSSPTGSTTPPASSTNPTPGITSIAPANLVAGSTGQTVTVAGTGFVTSSVVNLNGTPLKTTYVSASSVTAAVPDQSIAADGTVAITVTNPPPGGGTTTSRSYSIAVPTAAVASISPQSVPQGMPATITVNGGGFEANSIVTWNGDARPTSYISATNLQVALTAADVLSFGVGQIGVTNPNSTPTTPVDLQILSSTPVILNVSPGTLNAITGTALPQQVEINGSGFAGNATVLANGAPATILAQSATSISITLPAADFTSPGTIALLVTNPGPPAVTSNESDLQVTSPSNAAFTVSPNFAPSGSPDTTITLRGKGFYPDSVVSWNSNTLKTSFVDATSVTAVIPAALLSGFSQASISVKTPEQSVQPASQPFSTFLALPVNDIVYRRSDGYIYASIPGSAGQNLGNTIAAIDATTGVIVKTIFVGSEPTRMAISTDGTELFVGLNGAAAVREVDLTTATAGPQVSLGGGPGIYNPPYTAVSLAAVPGQAKSVAVYATDGVVRIFDDGVVRANDSSKLGLSTYFVQNVGALAFGKSASELFVTSTAVSQALYKLDVDATGITSAHPIGTGQVGQGMQYDNGRLYFDNAIVFDAETGNKAGQFSLGSSIGGQASPAVGPIVSDSSLERVWILPSNYGQPNQLIVYDATTFNPISSTAITGVSQYGPNNFTHASDLIRWGQNGLAFHTSNQLYVLKGSIVKDDSGTPADVSITIAAPPAGTTGSQLTYQLKVQNQGPNAAQGVSATTALPASVFPGQIQVSQGSCAGTLELYCDLGTIPIGGFVTVSIPVTPTTADTLHWAAYSSTNSDDPVASNNQATASTSVTGALFSAPPAVAQLVPSSMQAGSGTQTFTVNGSGFSSASTVLWNGRSLPTTLVSSSQLTATLDTSLTQHLGWALVSVSTSAPGGGQSAALPFTIYQLVSVSANSVIYDSFSRKLYASLPSTSTDYTGNSVVAIDPFTGTVGTPVLVGSEPNVLSETDDGTFLYVGLNGANSLARFDLLTGKLDGNIPLPTPPQFYAPSNGISGMAVLPGSDNSLAVGLSYDGAIGILDVAGLTGTWRSQFSGIYAGVTPVFGNATHFYAYDSATSGAEFYRYSVDSSGVHEVDGTTLVGFGGFSGSLAVDSGLVYGASGGIVNPATTPPTQVGVLPLGSGPYGTGLFGGGVVPYAAEAKSFTIVVNGAGTALDFIERFDTSHFTMEDQIEVPNSTIGGLSGVRWGQDGLAYVIPTATSGPVGVQPSQLMLIQGPFVVPSEAIANAAPSISSTDHNTIGVGSLNTRVTISGADFLPGASALWNGAIRTTTYVDSAHVIVAVPAADLVKAATVALTVRNPGSSASNSLSISIQ